MADSLRLFLSDIDKLHSKRGMFFFDFVPTTIVFSALLNIMDVLSLILISLSLDEPFHSTHPLLCVIGGLFNGFCILVTMWRNIFLILFS